MDKIQGTCVKQAARKYERWNLTDTITLLKCFHDVDTSCEDKIECLSVNMRLTLATFPGVSQALTKSFAEMKTHHMEQGGWKVLAKSVKQQEIAQVDSEILIGRKMLQKIEGMMIEREEIGSGGVPIVPPQAPTYSPPQSSSSSDSSSHQSPFVALDYSTSSGTRTASSVTPLSSSTPPRTGLRSSDRRPPVSGGSDLQPTRLAFLPSPVRGRGRGRLGTRTGGIGRGQGG